MRLRLIACNVFVREACLCVARSPHTIDPVFTEIGEHVNPEALRERLQALVDEADDCDIPYAATLLLFGLCGNATVGLRAGRHPLVIPRAHDCCTILLGSRQAFVQEFGDNPSTPFSSCGYLERGDYFLRTGDDKSELGLDDGYQAYVEQYGEENAKYLWETLHPRHEATEDNRAVFIENEETAALGFAERFHAQAEEEGRNYSKIDGSLRIIEALVNGDWPTDDFLVLQSGEAIAGVYDMEQIVKAATTQN